MRFFIRGLLNVIQNSRKSRTFTDDELGNFDFSPGIGWVKTFSFYESSVELVFGSGKNFPSDEMFATAKMWVHDWDILYQKLSDYVKLELAQPKWKDEFDSEKPFLLSVTSIAILFEDSPEIAMIEFDLSSSIDDRVWHATFANREPQEISFDH